MSGNGARETRQEAADRVASPVWADCWQGWAGPSDWPPSGGSSGRRPHPQPIEADPAEELRSRLEQARDAADDRDEFDAAEGQPVDEVEQPRSIDERRQAVHEKAQEALGEMHRSELAQSRKSS